MVRVCDRQIMKRSHHAKRRSSVRRLSRACARSDPIAAYAARGNSRRAGPGIAGRRKPPSDHLPIPELDFTEAGTGSEALRPMAASDIEPDLALVDQFMPELDRWGISRRVRASEPYRALRVVMIRVPA